MNTGESEAFISYLHSHILHVDVWDGDSLMLIGSVGVPLKVIIRLKIGVMFTCELMWLRTCNTKVYAENCSIYEGIVFVTVTGAVIK